MSALTEQLDALLAEHGLSSITLTRIARANGDGCFWSINAQDNGQIGGNGLRGGDNPAAEIAVAIEELNAKRHAPVVVPELEQVA